MKMSGNYDILSLEYRPFAEGAEKREMPWDSPRETAFTWRGINLDSFDQAWELICQYCKSNITEVAYNTWFSRLKPVSLDFDRATAVIEAPNEFHKQTLLRCYSDLLKEAFDNVFGGGISFQICVHEELKQQQAAPDPFEQDDYELTFDTFVVGPSNRFAHAACQAVAAKPALLYNPLFIYGSSGLGKTHLLNAVAKEFKKNFPDRSVIYAKSEDFTNEIIAAIARGTTPAFREKYRKADLFLMDDIQFIAGKQSTQEEFFNTFNNIYNDGHQIVITADRPPMEMSLLDDRLRTRFEGGLMADVQPPDLETRTAIIRNKAAQLGMCLPDEVVTYIAENITSNVRQIEGVVKRLTAYREIMDDSITIASVKRAIKDVIRVGAYIPTPEVIIEETARYFSITAADIRGQRRSKNLAKARQVSMYLMRNLTNLSLVDIGSQYEGRNHSTVLTSIRKVEDLIKTDPEISATVRDISSNINSRS